MTRSLTSGLCLCVLALLAVVMVVPVLAEEPPEEVVPESVETAAESGDLRESEDGEEPGDLREPEDSEGPGELQEPEDSEVPGDLQELEDSEEPGGFMRSIDDTQGAISRTVTGMSRRMDLKFGTLETFPDEAYDSVLRLGIFQRFDQGGDGQLEFRAGGKLSLPSTQKRLSLVFLTDDFDDPLDRERGTDPVLVEEQTRQSLALRLLQPVKRWRTDVSVGLRANPIDLLTRFSVWRDFSAGDLGIRPKFSVFWYNERGTGGSTDLRLQHPLGASMLLRSDSSATWFERDVQVYYDQAFSLLQPVGRRRDLLWQIVAQAEREPNYRVSRYYAQVRWRGVLYRDWLIMELRPQAMRERENLFRTQLRLYIGFELLFGDLRSY